MMINPKDFGAVGDGIADDTCAVQDALNAATGSYFVDLGRNVFLVKDLNVSWLKIMGHGGKLKIHPDAEYLLRVAGDDSEIEFYNIGLDGSNVSIQNAISLGNSGYCQIRGVKLHNFAGRSVFLEPSLSGADIQNCEIYDCAGGDVVVVKSSNVNISKLYAHDIENGRAIRFGRFGNDDPNLRPRNNQISDSIFANIPDLAPVLFELGAHQSSLVNSGFSGTRQIAKAEDASNIQISGNRYSSGSAVVADTPIIQYVNSQNSIISNNEITGGLIGIQLDGASPSAAITGNVTTNTIREGIRINSGAHSAVINGNAVRYGGAEDSYGIRVDANDCIVNANLIKSNAQGYKSGIALLGTDIISTSNRVSGFNNGVQTFSSTVRAMVRNNNTTGCQNAHSGGGSGNVVLDNI